MPRRKGKPSPRFRVGKVTVYEHHGAWWVYYRDAGQTYRRKVAEEIRRMDTREGPAKFFPGGRVKFDEAGRRVDADLAIVQWQDGVPVTIYPPASALAQPIWPKN